MAKTNLTQLKNWFKTGLKPTQAQFWNVFDSFRHKDDKVPVSEVDGIDALISQKADADALAAHIADESVHGGGGGGSVVFDEDFEIVAPAGKLGGYNDGETVSAGDNVLDVVKKILRDGEPVFFYPPTGSVNSTKGASGLYEIGEQITMTLSYSFNQNDAGGLQSVAYRKDGNTIDPVNHQITIGSTAQVFDALIAYAAGSGSKFNDVGEEFPNTIGAGSIDTANLSYAGQYPFFFGKSASKPTPNQTLINGSTKKTSGSLIVSANGTLNINFGASGEFVWFAIPSTAPAKNTYYKTALDTGSVGLVFESPVLVNIDSPDGRWSGVSYRFYISKNVGVHNTNMELRN